METTLNIIGERSEASAPSKDQETAKSQDRYIGVDFENLLRTVAEEHSLPLLYLSEHIDNASQRQKRLPCDWYDLAIWLVLFSSAAVAIYCLLLMTRP